MRFGVETFRKKEAKRIYEWKWLVKYWQDSRGKRRRELIVRVDHLSGIEIEIMKILVDSSLDFNQRKLKLEKIGVKLPYSQ